MADITSETKLDNDENLDHDEHKRNIHPESEYGVALLLTIGYKLVCTYLNLSIFYCTTNQHFSICTSPMEEISAIPRGGGSSGI